MRSFSLGAALARAAAAFSIAFAPMRPPQPATHRAQRRQRTITYPRSGILFKRAGYKKLPPDTSTMGAYMGVHAHQRASHRRELPNHCIGLPSGCVSRGASIVTRQEANAESW